jgi:hypothetical protein
MEQEIAAWKRSQERNKFIYSFKYVPHKNEVPDLNSKEEEIILLRPYIEDLSEENF